MRDPKIAGLLRPKLNLIVEALVMRKFAFVFLFFLVACFDSDDNSFQPGAQPVQHVPVISNLSMSPNSAEQMQGDGTVTVTATFDFEDTGLDIASMQIDVSDGSSSAIDLAGTINTKTGSISQQINVLTTHVGTFAVTIWLDDAVGDESNRLDRNVTVVNDVSGESDWVPRVTGLADVLNDVLWNGNEFLAVGNRGTILRSADGIDWTSVDSGTASNLHAIGWNGFTYAVVGDAATVIVSDDGENWTQQSGGFGLPYHAVAYSDTLLVAGGWSEFAGPGMYISSSADNGVTMVNVNVLPQSGRAITDMAWGDGTFVATTVRMESGDNREARMLTSVDGLVWTEVVASTEAIGTFSILWDGDLFWAGGRVGRIYTSPDGNTRIEIQTQMQASIFTGIAESGEALIADGYNEWIGWGPVPDTGVKTEDNGISWTTFVIERDFDTNGLAFGNGRFVAVGCSGDEYACSDFGGEVEGAIYSTP